MSCTCRCYTITLLLQAELRPSSKRSLCFPQALIRCYCYEKYFNHAVNAAAAAQKKFSNAPIYSFFHAYGTLMQGKNEKHKWIDGMETF